MAQETPADLHILAVAQKWQSELEQYAPVIARGLAMFNSMSLGIQAVAQEIFPRIALHLHALERIDWSEAIRRMQALPAQSKAAMTLAAGNGWFFGWSDSLQGVIELIDKLNGALPDEIDQVLTQYYRDNLDFFADELFKKHPARAPVIQAAVNAHKALGTDGYCLAIPVFIAQADGLLTEIADVKSAFMKDTRVKDMRGQPELQASVALREQLAADPALLDLIHPLLTLHDLDFMKSANARKQAAQKEGGRFTVLNRHQVMHGEVSDYGTEINSLKAFSLLTFIGTHLPEILQRERSTCVKTLAQTGGTG
ncbi:conserved hypothetical protein [Paraburkholderia piptadeniae]|uniref:Uncharacterized protein n=1 Tax=Paraburkholderia piptadeniae TaxID=1701573 RepID=A0A1N7SPB5_9BURK|nr:hypothetical protein [Paraburkholderia piptadeniae]SIT49263.1 conserved hypothetical protein [Paraburkholderia piptadeniae]